MIENEQRNLLDQNEKIVKLQVENEEQINEMTNLYSELIKIKDEPLRYGKGADILKNAYGLLESDLKQINEDTAKRDKILSDQMGENERLNLRFSEYENTIEIDIKEIQKNKSHIKKLKLEIRKLNEEYNVVTGEKYKWETDLKALVKEYHRHLDRINSMKKSIENSKRIYKKEESIKNKLNIELSELVISKDKYKKEEADLKNEQAKINEDKTEIEEGIILLVGKSRLVADKTHDKNEEKKLIEAKIVELEKEIHEFQQIENNALKTIKNLSGLRESMARKASSAMAEVRETREELKIKELLILDLRKKQQETEGRLNNYKVKVFLLRKKITKVLIKNVYLFEKEIKKKLNVFYIYAKTKTTK